MNKTSIIEGISNYIDEDVIPFSMPGHKNGRAFKDIESIFLKGDLTEVDGLDNLHKPEGIIKEAEERLSNIYKSTKSYFLVNGSTCGNLIMIFSAFNEGDKVLVERNCHRSIMNGLIMRKLKPVFIKNIVSEELKAPIGLDKEHLKETLRLNSNIKGIILTYPNYYGIGLEIDNIIKMCKEKDIKILIDSAHGAHFGFHRELPKSAQSLGADMVVMSAHKTLPSLTQTSWLHINKEKYIEKVEFYKSIFMSTSPSYIFMISLDYARSFLQYNGEKAYDVLLNNIKNFNKKVENLSYAKMVNKPYLQENNKDNMIEYDSSRIVINLCKGFNGNKLLDYLRKCRIQCEMSDNKNVVLIPSPFNKKEEFDILANCLLDCDKEYLKDEDFNYNISDIPEMRILPYKVIELNKEEVKLDNCIGRIVADNIVPYPPGVPLLIIGEVIEKEHINIIKNYIRNKATIIGIYDNKLKVIKE